MESKNPRVSPKIKEEKSNKTPYLPEEVIEEILSRLPVKSLLKFRCIAKSWCFLIGSKRLMKTHLKNSITSASFAHHRIFVNTIREFGQCSLPWLLNEPYTGDSINFNTVDGIDYGRDTIYLVGCCNGLVCILQNEQRFMLWNPTTKKSRFLPDFDNHSHGRFRYIPKYGFGYDELNDDYKVFGILMIFYENNSPVRHISKVYSLKSDSWKVIDASLFDDYGAGMYASSSGKLNWLRRSEIASFDLNTHVQGVVQLPNDSDPDQFVYRLRVRNGCLLLLGFCPTKLGLDIWMMKEYGLVKESWDKVATFPCYDDPPIIIIPNGEVLVLSNSNFRIYNPKHNVFRYLPIDNCFPLFEYDIYVESLASVVSDAGPSQLL